MGDVDTTVAQVGRELLDGPLDEYVARRKAVARRLRDAGDREGAKAVEAMAKPTVVLFAALRAADDPDAVRAAVDATSEVARVQTGSGDRSALATATAERRARIDDLVDTGLAAAGGGGGSGRADEVRAAVDLLTRHDEVLGAWLDGTLRDLPRSDAGFGSLGLASVFTDGGSTADAAADGAPRSGARGSARKGRTTSTRTTPDDDAELPAPTAAQRRARATAEKAVERAEAALSGAAATLDDASAAVEDAEAAVEEAAGALRGAEAAAERARGAAAHAEQARDEAAAELDERRGALRDLDT